MKNNSSIQHFFEFRVYSKKITKNKWWKVKGNALEKGINQKQMKPHNIKLHKELTSGFPKMPSDGFALARAKKRGWNPSVVKLVEELIGLAWNSYSTRQRSYTKLSRCGSSAPPES